jgi:hypothetical protein
MATKKEGRPATTPEEREKQLQNLAYDLAEKQLRAGTASSQLTTQLLKGGGIREQLEMERLRNENRLLIARVEGMEAMTRIEDKIEAALEAFRSYSPSSDDDD